MELFIILLFAWVIQSQEILRKEFQFNTTIYDPKNYIDPIPCNGPDEPCIKYKEELCNLVLNVMPDELAQWFEGATSRVCLATSLTKLNNHTMNWNIKIYIVSVTSAGRMIHLDCPTFGNLYSYSLNNFDEVSRIKQGIIFTVNDYEPRPIPFSPKEPTDALLNVNAYLCYEKGELIPPSEFSKFTDTYILELLQEMQTFIHMGYWLIRDRDVKLTNFMKNVTAEKIFVKYDLLLPKDYVMRLGINPYCDTDTLLEMVLIGAFSKDIFLCDVTVKAKPPPTEMPPTTTGLASTTTGSIKTCVYAVGLSLIAANI